MTPIVDLLKRNTPCSSGKDLGLDFSIRWKIGNFVVDSQRFHLKSSASQIPEEHRGVRPRHKTKSEDSPIATSNVSTPQTKPVKYINGGKRRATESLKEIEEIFYHVKVQGDTTHRGFITLPQGSTLKEAREQISLSTLYPKTFLFWHETLKTITQHHQEEEVLVADAVEGTCLILDPYDITMEHIDHQILSLWLSQKNVRDWYTLK